MPTQNVLVSEVAGTTVVNIDPAHISIKGHDEIIWHTDKDKGFTVTFPKDSPFASKVFRGAKGKPVHSGPAVVLEHDKDFKYTAQVDGADPLDPVVHTDP